MVAPDLWDENNNGNWSILSKLGEVPGKHWASALVPAIIIVVLFYFDHNVSAQLASSGDMRRSGHDSAASAKTSSV